MCVCVWLVCALILTRLDYCNSLFAGLPDSTPLSPTPLYAITACSSCCCSFRRGPATTRPRNSDTHGTALATSSPTHYIQTVLSDARSCIRTYSELFKWHGSASVTSPGRSAFTISATRPLRRTAFTNGLRLQVVFCRCSASLEWTASWHPSNQHISNI